MSEVASEADDGPAVLLPEAVRQRLVAMTLDVLDSLGEVPASLRPVMGFAPQRRARLAAAPIAAALEDDDFRDRVAGQVRPGRADLIAALERGDPVAADPVEVGAMAYLFRPDGWQRTLAEAVTRLDAAAPAVSSREEELTRLRQQVEDARSEFADVRERLRQQVSQLKSDNADLRRKLGAERTRAKQAVADAESAQAAEELARQEAARQVSAAQIEARRLQTRIEELSAEATRVRQSGRAERGSEAMRARLLLDALLEAAQGLRRELALPPVETLPADTLAGADERPIAAAGGRALDPASPALLEHLLAVPRIHLLVDGYNVTKLEWAGSSLEEQRTRLLRELAPVAARSGAEVTVVFDGADLRHRPAVKAPRGIRVRFSPAGVTADEVLRDLVRAEPEGRTVVVVSSDREVAGDATRAGARAIQAVALVRLLDRG